MRWRSKWNNRAPLVAFSQTEIRGFLSKGDYKQQETQQRQMKHHQDRLSNARGTAGNPTMPCASRALRLAGHLGQNLPSLRETQTPEPFSSESESPFGKIGPQKGSFRSPGGYFLNRATQRTPPIGGEKTSGRLWLSDPGRKGSEEPS